MLRGDVCGTEQQSRTPGLLLGRERVLPWFGHSFSPSTNSVGVEVLGSRDVTCSGEQQRPDTRYPNVGWVRRGNLRQRRVPTSGFPRQAGSPVLRPLGGSPCRTHPPLCFLQSVKKFPCHLCERSFCSAPSLRRHVRVNHEGIKRVYPCRYPQHLPRLAEKRGLV